MCTLWWKAGLGEAAGCYFASQPCSQEARFQFGGYLDILSFIPLTCPTDWGVMVAAAPQSVDENWFISWRLCF